MKEKEDRIVQVEWVDSSSSSGWHYEHKDTDLNCQSVGFLAEKNKTRIKIYQSKAMAGQKGEYMEIPMCAVKKIKYLK